MQSEVARAKPAHRFEKESCCAASLGFGRDRKLIERGRRRIKGRKAKQPARVIERADRDTPGCFKVAQMIDEPRPSRVKVDGRHRLLPGGNPKIGKPGKISAAPGAQGKARNGGGMLGQAFRNPMFLTRECS